MNEIDATEVTDRDNLAVIFKIEALEPIHNKDRIVLCKMFDCGYTAIVEKGIHSVGDLVVFVKYDTIVPDIAPFDFMRESKFRVKPKSFTVRDDTDEVIDKIYSQGIVIPFKMFTDHLDTTDFWDKLEESGFEGSQVQWAEGDDVTTHLGVKKYLPPVKSEGTSFGVMASRGSFPTHICNKTDETNLCSKKRALEEIQGMSVYLTLKLEGSSGTAFIDDATDELRVCSRNNIIGFHETNAFWRACIKNGIEEKLKANPNIILQWELCAPKVQRNKLHLTEPEMFVFNVIDKQDRRRFGYHEMVQFLTENDIPMVPICCEIKSFDWDFDKLQRYADIQKYDSGELAEGIVVRPYEPFFSKVLKEAFSVKVINRDYKL